MSRRFAINLEQITNKDIVKSTDDTDSAKTSSFDSSRSSATTSYFSSSNSCDSASRDTSPFNTPLSRSEQDSSYGDILSSVGKFIKVSPKAPTKNRMSAPIGRRQSKSTPTPQIIVE